MTEERRMLRDTLRKILARHENPDWLWDALAEAGVFRALLTEAEGGIDGSPETVALIFEELGRSGSCIPVLENVVLGAGMLAVSPDFEDLVESVLDGSHRVAFACLDNPTTRFELCPNMPVQDDMLSGRKYMVIGGETADWIVVTTADGFYLVARDVPGMSRRGYTLLDGNRAADLEFKRSPATRLSGADERWRQLVLGVLGRCSQMLGAMERAKEITIDYLKMRQQFGRPLADFQVLSHRLVDMAIEIEQSRSAIINIITHIDTEGPERARWVTAAKNLVNRTAEMVVEETIQMHGGIGLSSEYPLSRYLRCLTTYQGSFWDADCHLEIFMRANSALGR